MFTCWCVCQSTASVNIISWRLSINQNGSDCRVLILMFTISHVCINWYTRKQSLISSFTFLLYNEQFLNFFNSRLWSDVISMVFIASRFVNALDIRSTNCPCGVFYLVLGQYRRPPRQQLSPCNFHFLFHILYRHNSITSCFQKSPIWNVVLFTWWPINWNVPHTYLLQCKKKNVVLSHQKE